MTGLLENTIIPLVTCVFAVSVGLVIKCAWMGALGYAIDAALRAGKDADPAEPRRFTFERLPGR